MKIYIDADYKCHVVDDGTMQAIETDFFDGKCDAYIEGFRFVPEGRTWVREDGTVFYGNMIAPWKPSEELDSAQREYERARLTDARKALAILLGGEIT
jgi:hypothetical protein